MAEFSPAVEDSISLPQIEKSQAVQKAWEPFKNHAVSLDEKRVIDLIVKEGYLPSVEHKSDEIKLNRIQELQGEQNYYDKIRRIEGSGKLLKKLRSFSTLEEAEAYISTTPSKSESALQKFIPPTEYLVENEDGRKIVYAIMPEIHGRRLDTVDLESLDRNVTEQLDFFLSESLKLFETDKVCPGINLKNIIIDDEDAIHYIDSEPYPSYNLEAFEMAHAREQKLTRLFGDSAAATLPLTWQWINTHRVENYKKAKSEAERRRREAAGKSPALVG